MTNRFLISAAVAALIAGTGFANAQGMGNQGMGSRPDAGLRIFHNGRTRGVHFEAPACLEEQRGAWLACELEPLQIIAVHTHVEKLRHPRSGLDRRSIAARGDEGSAHASLPEGVQEVDSPSNRRYPVGGQFRLEECLLIGGERGQPVANRKRARKLRKSIGSA